MDFLGRDEILSTTPSFHVRAFHAGQQAIDVAIGESFKFYDIASLTKIVYTTTRIMELVDQSMLDLDVDLKEYLGESYSGDSSLRRLLTHSAGHGWWKAFYEELLKDPTANHSIDTKLQWQKMEKLLKNPEQEKEPDQFVYSDIDFLLLGWVLRAKLQTSLEDDFQRFKKRWGLENTFFSVNNICPIDSENVAPTEYSEWREKRMQGQVHDENTYALGGVSSHAGLISTMDDLSRWALKIRAALLEIVSDDEFKPADLKRMQADFDEEFGSSTQQEPAKKAEPKSDKSNLDDLADEFGFSGASGARQYINRILSRLGFMANVLDDAAIESLMSLAIPEFISSMKEGQYIDDEDVADLQSAPGIVRNLPSYKYFFVSGLILPAYREFNRKRSL